MHDKKVDIFILSGFLGSGKSTLLKDLIHLEKNRGRKIGVLMNELGTISIDSSIIPNGTPLKEMLNGCICCSIKGELSLQLKFLLEEYELDVIYIEATGAANPLDVVDACTHPVIAGYVNIKAVITVVNAKQWHENKISIKLRKLLIAQVKYADIVLINKTDLIRENVQVSLKNSLKEINNQASIQSVKFGKISYSTLYSSDNVNVPSISRTTIRDKSYESHVHDHLHLSTISFPIKYPIDRKKFIHWLNQFDGKLHRAKGFIFLTETPGLFLFNYAYGEPVFERFSFEKQYSLVLVFIGEQLDKCKIEQELLALQK
ncbi:MAG: CobW family GTP-binding protein [Bacillota bacterium]